MDEAEDTDAAGVRAHTKLHRDDAAPGVERFRSELREWLQTNSERLQPWQDRPHPTMELALTHEAELIALLFEESWGRWGWPASVGGLGGSALLRGVLYDELWGYGIALPEQYAPMEVMGPTLAAVNPELAAAYLPAFIAGKEWWCQGFSEPEAGSDLASLRTRGRRDGDGETADFIVNGQKIWSSFGATCQRAMVLVRTGTPQSRHRGLTMLFVDLDSPGVTKRPIALASGRDELAELFFDDVRVPYSRLLGQVDGGWATTMQIMQYERGTYAWQRQAMLLHRLRLAAQQISDNDARAARQVGQAYREIIAVRAQAAGSFRRIAVGDVLGPETSVDKVLLGAAEHAVYDVVRELMPEQFLLGETPEAQKWRHDWWYSRATTIYGGAAEVQRGLLADRVLKLPRESPSESAASRGR